MKLIQKTLICFPKIFSHNITLPEDQLGRNMKQHLAVGPPSLFPGFQFLLILLLLLLYKEKGRST